MNKQDKKVFGTELLDMIELLSRGKVSPSPTIVQKWWKALEPYSLDTVLSAFALYERNNKFSPVPADIIEIITTSDGRPEAEEAWAIALKSQDEADTVVWTSEIAQAMAFVQSLTDAGDNNVSARMAFKQHYERLLVDARAKGIPVNWQISAGHDVARRNDVLNDAETKGLISHEQAKPHLIEVMTDEGKAIAGLLGYSGEVTPITDSKLHKQRMQELREKLKRSDEIAETKRQELIQKDKDHLEQRRALLIKQSEGGLS